MLATPTICSMNKTESASAWLRVLLWLGGISAVLTGAVAAFFIFTFDTQYTPGYSSQKFNSLKLGDSKSHVLASLGPPFSTEATEPYVAWIYSNNSQPGYPQTGEGRGTHTTFRFDTSNRVVSVQGMLQTSANSFTFGDGLNYLKLTESQIQMLKGRSQNEVQQQFGPPTASYESKASKLLRYSKSPSSANYHFRAVGLGGDGRVVKIWREIYWD
jgi:hypothetical protein